MRVAIIGYGVDGQSAAEYWKHLGDEITICDQNEKLEIPSFATGRLGAGYLKHLDEFDVIVRSSGINPSVILAGNPRVKNKITTVINEFLRVCPTKNIIGITGTKGKGTTATLTAKMLEAAGKHIFLGGNIGVSPLDFLPHVTADSYVVLELSSFQLYDLKYSPHIGVCLMVVPEHLNWHPDMGDYIAAKSNLFVHQTSHDVAIYFAGNATSHKIASASHGAKLTYFAPPGAYVADDQIMIDNQLICKTDELKLLGKHNWQNACAAATAVWQYAQDIAAIRTALTSFEGLEHRLEFVREVSDVKYYDDSFGTTPETAIVALQAFEQPKVLILGGSDKEADFTKLAQHVASSNVHHVILIGFTAPKIEKALRAAGFSAFSNGGKTIHEIVQAARTAARPGDIVLLSPACASFGMFKNYKERGNQFKSAVRDLG